VWGVVGRAVSVSGSAEVGLGEDPVAVLVATSGALLTVCYFLYNF